MESNSVFTTLVMPLFNALGSPYSRQLESLVCSLDPQLDNEDPQSFLDWLLQQNEGNNLPFGTRCLVDTGLGQVLGVGSLVPDDRGAAVFLQAHGIKVDGLIGGIQIFRKVPGLSQVRGLGLGTWLCNHLDREITAAGGGRWALMTDNPVAARIYLGIGYCSVDLEYGGERVFVKKYPR